MELEDPSDPYNKLIIRATVYGGSSFDGPIRTIAVTGNISVDKFFEEGNFVTCSQQNVLGMKRYEISNYLGNVHAVLTDRKSPVQDINDPTKVAFYRAEMVSNFDYYPFGQVVTTRSREIQKYSFAYNGMKVDDEISGEGNSYTAEFWQYDSRLGRRWNQDPKPNPSISNYACFANNPIMYSDPKGDTLKVTTKKGGYLFSLDDGKTELTVMTAKKLYSKGIQWFEPLADNYMALTHQAKDLTTSDALKHFSWDDIVKFSIVDRWMSSYRQGGSGDWKAAKEGADGYLLVTVDGKPYWADAIGQIPFAIDYYSDVIVDNNDGKKSIEMTMQKGREYGSGSIFGGEADNSNTYDNYFLLRGALYANKRYGTKWVDGYLSDGYELTRKNPTPDSNILGNPINGCYQQKYLDDLISNEKAKEKKKKI